jgi:hypothetical protein
MKTKKILIGFDQYRAEQIKRQANDIQKAYNGYRMALGEQGLTYYNDVEKSLEEASNAVQINSKREVKQEAVLSLIGILPQRPREAWNVCHRAITELGVQWSDINEDGLVNPKTLEVLNESCNIYAEGEKAVALALSLEKIKDASEEFYSLMQTYSYNRPNMGQVGTAFLNLLAPKGEGMLVINPSQFKMYSKN